MQLRDAGVPTPDWFAFNDTAFRELGAADTLPAIEQRLGFPLVVKPARQGSALGVEFAADRAGVPAALLAAFSYDDRVLLERYVDGRELAVSVLGEEALPIVEVIPHENDTYDFEARYEIGRTTFSCPAQLPDGEADAVTATALEAYRAARLLGLLAGRPDARRGGSAGAGGQRRAGPHRHQPAPAGGRGGRHGVRAAGGADRGAGARAAPVS